MNADVRDDVLPREFSVSDMSVFSGYEGLNATLFDELGKAISISDFKYKIKKIVNKMGFSDFIFRRVDSDDVIRTSLMTMPEELVRVYCEEAFYNNDLMVVYARYNNQPILSSQVYQYICDAPFETDLTAINRSIEKLYRRFGFYEFYSVSMKSHGARGNVQLSVTDKNVGRDAFRLKIEPYQCAFRQLCRAVDKTAVERFPSLLMEEDERRAVSITAKPLFILNKLANTDLTIAQLAQEMCISPITAHQHIAGARRALGVKTNIGAIKKAIKLKLISFV